MRETFLAVSAFSGILLLLSEFTHFFFGKQQFCPICLTKMSRYDNWFVHNDCGLRKKLGQSNNSSGR